MTAFFCMDEKIPVIGFRVVNRVKGSACMLGFEDIPPGGGNVDTFFSLGFDEREVIGIGKSV
jgi:hypothetical protein